ncbi:MAG TPA: hypothetical protein VLY23_06845 [Candidatus Acidoferrum sp.]|nr:hypothetical protein [Candidatus Acidoferrum sp.]
MRKTIAIFVCALLGLCAGYFVAPIASMGFVRWNEPDLFGAFAFSLVDSSISCSCENQPPAETFETLTDDLSTLQRWRKQNPESRILKQEIGLAQVRLSRIEQELGHAAQSDVDMKDGQEELAALGWKNLSAAHLIALTTQLDSEYKQGNQKTKSAVSAHPSTANPKATD